MRGAIFMVFPYMDHDLAGLLENSSVPKFQAPQVKLYLKQLLEGTLYLHKVGHIHMRRDKEETAYRDLSLHWINAIFSSFFPLIE